MKTELKTQSQTYRGEMSRLQAVVAGMSGEEIVWNIWIT